MAFAISPTRRERGDRAARRQPRSRAAAPSASPAASSGRRRAEKAVIKDTAELAKRYGYDRIDTSLHTDMSPEDAILEEAKKRNANVIVIGTSKRVGEGLYLGQTVGQCSAEMEGRDRAGGLALR